jgi:hypothetical protein
MGLDFQKNYALIFQLSKLAGKPYIIYLRHIIFSFKKKI